MNTMDAMEDSRAPYLAGEVLCMLSALPFLSTGVYAITMPNRLNVEISYYTFVILTLVMYVPFLPFLYSHMLSQRNRVYAKRKTA